ncbi:MAG: DGQHR domain-containing protein [Chloroflexi bacterium]|nr:DGQHR domain-containing protein [Chloroflexota bacterium]
MRQGGRDVFHTVLRMHQFDQAVPDGVSEEVSREHQRRFMPSHAKAILDYIRRNDEWLLGPITLSIPSSFVTFDPYPVEGESQAETDFPQLGELRLLEGAHSALRMIDGQHRRRAIRDFLRSTDVEETRLHDFAGSQMPVAIYVEDDITAIRQMFSDLAQQRKMDPVTTAKFNTRDPYNRAAMEIVEKSSWIGPFVDQDNSRVRFESEKLLALNQLADCLRTLQHGYGGRVSRTRLIAADAAYDKLLEQGIEWTDHNLPAARREIELLSSGGKLPDQLSEMRHGSLALNYTTIRLFAGCQSEWIRRWPGEKMERLTNFLRELNLLHGEVSSVLVDSGVIEPGGTGIIPRVQIMKPAIQRIVEAAYEHASEDFVSAHVHGQASPNGQGLENAMVSIE